MTFILKRLVNSLFVLFGVISIVFFLFFVILPADPARLSMGQRSDPKSIASIRKDLYLDRPLPEQFLRYINDLSPLAIHNRSNEAKEKYRYKHIVNISTTQCLVIKTPYLRRSYQTKKDVTLMLTDAFPGTLILASLAIFIATILGILLGALSAIKQHSWIDTSTLISSILGISTPSFFAAILMAYVFGFLLKSYTGLSIISPMWDFDPFTGKHFMAKSLILPVLTLAIRPMAIIVQITRSSLLEVIQQDYIRTAYAKGLSKVQVIWHHGLRNALNPIITSVSGWFAELLAGSFFIEYIFGWKGIGKITVDALNKFDFPVVMGSVLFTALIFICLNMLVDVLYRVVDPRIRYE